MDILGLNTSNSDTSNEIDESVIENNQNENVATEEQKNNENKNTRKISYKFDGVEDEMEINIDDDSVLKELIEKSKYADKMKSQKNEIREFATKFKNFAKENGFDSVEDFMSNYKSSKYTEKINSLMKEKNIDEEIAKQLVEAEDLKASSEKQNSINEIFNSRIKELNDTCKIPGTDKIKPGYEKFDLGNRNVWSEEEAQEISDFLLDNPSVPAKLYIDNIGYQTKEGWKENKFDSQKQINSKKSAGISHIINNQSGDIDYKDIDYDTFNKLSEVQQRKILEKAPYDFYSNLLKGIKNK